MASSDSKLVEYCKERTGENLRTVARYNTTSETLTVECVRDDLRSQYTDEQYEMLVEKLYDTHESVVEIGDKGAPIGDCVSSVHYFENGFVIQLVLDEDDGYIITFDSVVGSSLASFIEECLTHAGVPSELAQ
ncbi:hypothetical protein HUG10_02865 [Halorarum halophilum]|uniref:Uncharacterized protein n=1 Tax=Halorarum halophilum TaxID=2743090 RepID=A0A7D5GAL3_9EURY|nr:hypothetical protein [Halobaculum halophilum]QLG26545.1 hypothetical protein HUG10_02865 [Halobaculum halophilum]